MDDVEQVEESYRGPYSTKRLMAMFAIIFITLLYFGISNERRHARNEEQIRRLVTAGSDFLNKQDIVLDRMNHMEESLDNVAHTIADMEVQKSSPNSGRTTRAVRGARR